MAFTSRRVSSKLPALAFDLFRELGPQLRGQRLLIACSGGLDSVVLIDVLAKLAPRLDLELGLAHVHHGVSADERVTTWRNHAQDFVRSLADRYSLPFETQTASVALSSEDDFRKFRLAALDDMAKGRFDRIALAHHADDLLETRLMRLIRGTGPQGLRAMKEISEKSVRPFLKMNRDRLEAYARQHALQWIDDPSNADMRYFRNWIRREWLPALEGKRPGSKAALSRSLDLLCEAASPVGPIAPEEPNRFRRADFHRLSGVEKSERLASLVRGFSARDFGQAKIIEVLKRLDRLEVSRQRSASFVVGGVEWRVTSDEIEALRIHSSRADAGPRS